MFKPLHVWSSKEATRNEEKKKRGVQNLKWATAHLSRRLGAGRARHAGGARRLGHGTGARGVRQVGVGRGRQARGTWQGRHGRAARALGVRPGRAVGQQAVHLVH